MTKNQQETVKHFNDLYNELQSATKSYQRKKIFDVMKDLYNDHPILQMLWDLFDTVRKYIDRFVRKTKEVIENCGNAASASIKEVFCGDEPYKNNTNMDLTPVDGASFAYILSMFDRDGNFKYLKIGKANDVMKRCRQHLGYYNDIRHIAVERVFFCPSEDDALSMENALRKHYRTKENCGFVRNDRFTNCCYNSNDIDADSRISMQYALCNS